MAPHMSRVQAYVHVSPQSTVASLPVGLVLGPCLPSVSPDRAGGRWGLCPGRRLQLSPQRLSLPQAPLPEAWLEARWHGCSALAACKWIAAPPAPVLTPSPGLQAPGTLPSSQSSLTPPSSWCQRLPGTGWEGLDLVSGGGRGLAGAHAHLFLALPTQTCGGTCRRSSA